MAIGLSWNVENATFYEINEGQTDGRCLIVRHHCIATPNAQTLE